MRVNSLVLGVPSVQPLNVRVLFVMELTCHMDAQLGIKSMPTCALEIPNLGMLVYFLDKISKVNHNN